MYSTVLFFFQKLDLKLKLEITAVQAHHICEEHTSHMCPETIDYIDSMYSFHDLNDPAGRTHDFFLCSLKSCRQGRQSKQTQTLQILPTLGLSPKKFTVDHGLPWGFHL